jgi:hypothetical protein
MQVAKSIVESNLARFLVGPECTVAAAHQLTLSAGPASCSTPPGAAFQGAACWLHVHTGSLAVHAFPPNTKNLEALQKQRPGKAGSRSWLQVFEGVVSLHCGPKDTAVVPAGWLTSREFLEVSVVTSAALIEVLCPCATASEASARGALPACNSQRSLC